VKLKFLVVEGAAQFRFQLQAGHGALAHGTIEQLVAGLALGLGAVHGRIGIAEQVLGPVVTDGPQGDADAGAGEDLVAADQERLRQFAFDALGHGDGVIGFLDVFEQNGELVAAEPGDGGVAGVPGDGIPGAQTAFQPMGDGDQQLIAGGVAETVVDHLETIEIQEEDGDASRPAQSAPSRSPIMACAVRAMMGMRRVDSPSLSRRVDSQPSRSGKLMSIRIRAGASLSARRSPSRPFSA
jgi:hypothetical protein